MRNALPQLTGWRRFAPAAVLGMGLVLLGSVQGQRSMPLVRPLTALPASMQGFSSTEHVIGDDERRVAAMSQYVFRIFGDTTAPAFSVYVGYYDYQTQGKTIHSPKNCLPGGGWEPVEVGVDRVQTASGPATVNKYILVNGNNKALVYYWYQGRGRVASSEYRVKWELLRDAALYGRTEEALVRVVVPITEKQSRAQALEVARRVGAELIPAVSGVLPASPRAS